MTNFHKKVIFNSFIEGQFKCCPSLWILSTTAVNDEINRLDERGLIALLNDDTSIFKDKLSISKDTTIHLKNIQKLMIEFFKCLYSFSSFIMKGVLTKKVLKYNHLSCRVTLSSNPKTLKYDKDAVVNKADQICSIVSAWCKYLSLLDLFRSEIINCL